MATAIAEAFVLVKPQTEGFQSQLNKELSLVANKAGTQNPIKPKIQPDTKGLQTSLTSQFKRIAAIGTGIFATVFVLKGAADFLKGSIEQAQEAEKSQLQLNAAFSTFPKLADISADSLRTLNTQLALKTKFDDDAFASGQAVLAQFKLTGTQIKQLTPLLADYAARTGQDLPSAATALGRAFLGNTRALKTIGIQFKATGDTTKDYDSIVGLLQTHVGGFAEKEGKSFGGRLEIMRNQLGEVKETIGNAVLPVFARIADFLVTTLFPNLRKVANFLIETFRPAFQSLKDVGSLIFPIIKGLGEILLATLVPALRLASSALKIFGPVLLGLFVGSRVVSGIAAIGKAIRALAVTTALAGGPLNILKAGLSSLAGLFNPATALAAVFAVTIFGVAKAHADAKAKVQEFADALEQERKGVKGATNELILNRLEKAGLLKDLAQAHINVGTFIQAVKGDAAAFALVTQQIDGLSNAGNNVIEVYDKTTNSMKTVSLTSAGLTQNLNDLRAQQIDGLAVDTLKAKALDEISGSTDKTNTSTKALVETSTRYTRAVIRENKEVNILQGHFTKISGIVDHFKTSLDATLGALLNIQDSTAKYDQDLAALGESLKTNGKNFDLNTEKGRNNSSALRTVVGDIEDQIGALVKGGKIQATDTAQKDALITRLKELERRFPSLKGQVGDYITQVNKTPVTRSTKFNADTTPARKALSDFQTDLKKFGGRIAKESILDINASPIPIAAKIQSISAGTVNMTAQSVRLLNTKGLMAGGWLRPGEVGITGEGGRPEITVGGPAGTNVIPLNKAGVSSQDFDRLIQALREAVALSRPIQVTEVAQSPVATAEAVAARLGLAGVR